MIPTAHLSAEGIGIAGLAGESEDFSVESVSFGLSLLPLIVGNVEISGVTINRPVVVVETDASGIVNWSSGQTGEAPAPASIEDMIAGGDSAAPGAPSDTLAMLDRLSLGRVKITDGTLVWRDLSSNREERVDGIDLNIRVPRLDGPGTVEGGFNWLGDARSFEIELGERPDPTRFDTIPVNLTLTSEGGSIVAEGTAMAGEMLFEGSVASEGSSLAAFAGGYGFDLPDMPVFGAFDVTSRVKASASQIRIDEFGVDFGGLEARGGAVIGLDRARPGVGLKIAADSVDTALFVPSQQASSESSGEPTVSGSDAVDFSALRLFDANIDVSANQVLVGTVPVTDFGVDIQIVNGSLNATIRSAVVDGAPASGVIAIDAAAEVPTVKGDIKVDGLDAAALAALAGTGVQVTAGAVGADVAFATRGSSQRELIGNLDASGRVSLSDGHITGLELADYVGGDASANEVADVDLGADFSSLSAPIEAKGGLSWRGERFTISGRGDPRALASGRATPVSANASSQRVNFGFDGEAGLGGVGNGAVSLSTPSLRNLLAWIGHPLPAGGGLGPFSIKGAVALSQDTFSFDTADFTLDGSSGIGTGKLSFAGTPKITAGLNMKRLDLTPHLVGSGTGGAGTSTGTSGTGGGWSTEPIGFDGLGAIDANLNLKVDEIVADQIKIGPSRLTATISGGTLTAELTEMALYSGIGVGTLSIEGASRTPALKAFFRLDQIDALPFLRDAAGFSWIEGTASFTLDIRSSGANQAALMAALNGTGAMDFRDGAIRGIDIPKMVRSLSIETLLGWQQSGNEKTDFSQLSGTYAIENGILTNQDLILVGPLLRVTGAGTVDIPNQTLSYRVDPKIVASLQGQGGEQDLEGFAVPVRVEGAWSRPRIYPEIEGILQDPQRTLDQLRKLGGGLFGGTGDTGTQADAPAAKSVEDRINEELSKGLGKLFGGANSSDTPAPETPPSPAATAPSGQPAPVQPSAEAPPPTGQVPPSQDGAAQSAEQEPAPEAPPAAQPAPEPASPLDLLLGQPAPEGAEGAVQEPGSPDGAGEAPATTEQPLDLLKSILGQ